MSDNAKYLSRDAAHALESSNVNLFAEATGLNYRDAEYLMAYHQHYQPIEADDPKRATEHPKFKKLLQRGIGRASNQATHAGHISKLAALSHGQYNNQRIDATGYDLIIKNVKLPAQQIVIKGQKGCGKTTKTMDIVRHLNQEFRGNLKVAGNILDQETADEEGWEKGISADNYQFMEKMSSFLEFAKEDGEKVIIWDEASSKLNQWTGGSDAKDTIGRVINALRKGEGGSTRLIIIGHEHDTDIASFIRSQTDLVIYAEGKVDEGLIDKATLYEGWKNYQQGKSWIQIEGMRDVPKESDWAFDDNYFAVIDIDLDAPDKQIERGKLIDNWRDYQEEEDDSQEQEDTLERLESKVRCIATKDNGEQCKQTTDHPSEYCKRYHEYKQLEYESEHS